MSTRILALDELLPLIEEAVQAMPGSVKADTDLGTLDGWDSMGLVIFIELVQGRTGVELAVHDLRACSTAPEVLALISGTAPA
jgi:hypothetical protein